MFTIYVYVLETFADWELGYITSELHSGRFFKKDAAGVSLKTVSHSKDPIHTMGGLTVVPDCLIDDMVVPMEAYKIGAVCQQAALSTIPQVVMAQLAKG